ncbi:MAG: hypothetical protein ACI80K_003358 [Paracoccaceae bacterium]
MTTPSYLSNLMYAAALSGGFFLSACSCEEGCDVPESTTVPTSQMVGVSAGITGAEVVGSPDSVMRAALQSLRKKQISGFFATILPPEEFEEMREGWKDAKSKPVPERDDKEFQSFMGMATAEGAEETLFMMVKPFLEDAQEELQGMTMMLPMLAAGALENTDVPPEAHAMVGQLATEIASLDITDEAKARRAISVFVKAARDMKVTSGVEMQALSFEEVMGRADVAYAGLIDILDVYGLSPQKSLESMTVKTVSTEGDSAVLEMTFSIFGGKPQTVPFEMERLDGRWFPKPPEKDASPQNQGLAR